MKVGEGTQEVFSAAQNGHYSGLSSSFHSSQWQEMAGGALRVRYWLLWNRQEGDWRASGEAGWQWQLNDSVLDFSCPYSPHTFQKRLIFAACPFFHRHLVFCPIWPRTQSCWFFLYNEKQNKSPPELEIGLFSIRKLWGSWTNTICPKVLNKRWLSRSLGPWPCLLPHPAQRKSSAI